MKKLISFFILFLATTVFGDIYSVRIDSSLVNIPTSYTTASSSKVLNAIRNIRGVYIDNRSSSEVAVECSTGTNSTAPLDASIHNIYANQTGTVALGSVGVGNYCFIRSMTGSAITSGIVVLMVDGG